MQEMWRRFNAWLKQEFAPVYIVVFRRDPGYADPKSKPFIVKAWSFGGAAKVAREMTGNMYTYHQALVWTAQMWALKREPVEEEWS